MSEKTYMMYQDDNPTNWVVKQEKFSDDSSWNGRATAMEEAIAECAPVESCNRRGQTRYWDVEMSRAPSADELDAIERSARAALRGFGCKFELVAPNKRKMRAVHSEPEPERFVKAEAPAQPAIPDIVIHSIREAKEKLKAAEEAREAKAAELGKADQAVEQARNELQQWAAFLAENNPEAADWYVEAGLKPPKEANQ